MANAINITLTVKDDGTAVIRKVSGELGKLRSDTERMGRETEGTLVRLQGSWLELSAKIFVVEQAFARVWAAARRGAQFEEDLARLNQQMNGFHATAQLMINDLQAVTNGQLSAAQAAQLASRGLALGLNPDQVRLFAQAADLLGDVLGTDLNQAFDRILDSLQTGRTQVLANIGVYVDLEQEVRKLAFATDRTTEQITTQERAMLAAKAVYEQAGEALARFGSDQVSAADELASFSAQLQDAVLELDRFIGKLLVDGIRALKDFAAAAQSAEVNPFRRADQALRALTPGDPNHPVTQEIFGRAIVAQTQAQVAALEQRLAQERSSQLLAQSREQLETALGQKILENVLHQQRMNALQEISKSLAQQLTAEYSRQAAERQRLSGFLESFEEGVFRRSLKGLAPEEQLQRLRGRALELAGDPRRIQQLAALIDQAEALGNVPGVEEFIRQLEFEIPLGVRAAQDALTKSMQGIAGNIDPVTGLVNNFNMAFAQLLAQLKDPAVENAPLLRTLESLKRQLAEVTGAAQETSGALAGAGLGGSFFAETAPGFNIRPFTLDAPDVRQDFIQALERGFEQLQPLPPIFPSGIGQTSLNIRSGTGIAGFQAGTRATRRGLAFLHEGEAVIPAEENFLAPGLSQMERAERLARLAVGQIPSFQGGVRFFSSTGFNPLSIVGDLPILNHPNAAQLLRDFSFSLQELLSLRSQLVQEQAVFQLRTRPEQFLGTLGAGRVTTEGTFIGQRLTQLLNLLDTRIRDLGGGLDAGGTARAGGGGITIQVTVQGSVLGTPDQMAAAVRDKIVPELRRLGLSQGGF